MFLKIERQTIKKEKERYFWRKKLNIIEKKEIVYQILYFFQFMYKNISFSYSLTLTVKVSRGLNYFSLNAL